MDVLTLKMNNVTAKRENKERKNERKKKNEKNY